MDICAALAPDPLYRKESERHANKLEAWGTAALRWLARKRRQPLWRTRRILAQVHREAGRLAGAGSGRRARARDEVAFDLRCNGITQAGAARFALVRQAGRLALGKAHFDVQLLGGWAMLQGMVAEMNTGEGKTLTATLPAATAALAGLPVHVITTNDYLVERDAQIMTPLYQALGLSVAWVSMEMDPAERRRAYRADIVYCSNKTLVFDYLRDLIVLDDDKDEDRLRLERLRGGEGRVGELFLRGLCFAIVDEADSVLVDEARTPLIISGVQEEDGGAVTAQAMELAAGMREEHYLIQREHRRAALTESGREHLRQACAALPAPWGIPFRREELILSALTVLHLYRLDEQYIVRDGKVMVVDEFTGRVMPDRSWGQGLHQMIEHKEGLELSDPRATLKSISYQRFFKHYLLLAGMTGTAAEIRAELGRVYNLPVVRIPTHRKSRRIHAPDSVHRTMADKWAAVRERCRALHARGVPVLIGTRSVAASEEVAGAGRGGAAGGRAQRQAGRRRGRAGRARRGDRQHHDRHQHGRARHRHSLVGRRARGRRPARHPDRAARVRPHRPPARRPQRPPGRSRPCRGHPVAGGRRAGQRQEQPLVAADGCAAGDELPGWRAVAALAALRRRAPKENWPANAAAWCPRTKN